MIVPLRGQAVEIERERRFKLLRGEKQGHSTDFGSDQPHYYEEIGVAAR